MYPPLRAAIGALYDAFARPHPDRLDGCPCCTVPSELDELVRTPLRALTVVQLQPYASSAMTTVGDAADFRYFWPRLAELTVTLGPFDYLVDPEILLGKLPYGQWRTWSAAEQRAAEAYLDALILRMRDERLAPDDVDTWVCAVGQALDDVTPLLGRALLADTAAARANLHALYEENRCDLQERGRLRNAFWRAIEPDGQLGGLTPGAERVVAWFGQLDVQVAVDRACAGAAPGRPDRPRRAAG